MSEETKSGLVKVGALWRSKKQGVLSGKMGDAQLLVVANKFKEDGSKQPDFIAFVATPQKRDEGSPAAAVDETDVPF